MESRTPNRRAFSALLLTVSLMAGAGCVSHEAVDYLVVDDARRAEPINIALATCGGLELTQSCDLWQGANLELEVSNQRFKIAGSERGDKILLMLAKDACESYNVHCYAAVSNTIYKVVKERLAEHDLTVLKVRPCAVGRAIDGYYLHVDGDAYSTLVALSGEAG